MLQAHDWYEARVSGLGVQFAHAVDAAVSLIEEHPEAFPIVEPDARGGLHADHSRLLALVVRLRETKPSSKVDV